VTIVLDEAAAEQTLAADVPASRATRPGGGTTEGLIPRYTFDAFVVGSSNQFAQAACEAVAELPSKAYNPLFVYGGVGLGKTHLLHAVGYQSAKLFPGMAVVYITSERFTNELINGDSLRPHGGVPGTVPEHRPPAHRRHPVHLGQGADAGGVLPHLQHALRVAQADHRLERLATEGHPGDRGAPALAVRVGLIADIQPPDFETRVAILKKKAALERVRLADDVAYLIASRVKFNIRELEGVAHAYDRLLLAQEVRDVGGTRAGGARRALGRGKRRSSRSSRFSARCARRTGSISLTSMLRTGQGASLSRAKSGCILHASLPTLPFQRSDGRSAGGTALPYFTLWIRSRSCCKKTLSCARSSTG